MISSDRDKRPASYDLLEEKLNKMVEAAEKRGCKGAQNNNSKLIFMVLIPLAL